MEEEKLSAKEQYQIYTSEGEINHFTKEQLKKKWLVFIQRLNDRPNLKATLSRIPNVDENYQLLLNIDNSVQEDLINSVKPELVSWLRRELKNSKIHLVTNIKQAKREKIIYSDSDKYMEMIKKNSKLELLKRKFKLDFE